MSKFDYRLTHYYKDKTKLEGLCNDREGIDYKVKKSKRGYAVFTQGKLALPYCTNVRSIRKQGELCLSETGMAHLSR